MRRTCDVLATLFTTKLPVISVPWSKLRILGIFVPLLTGNPYNGYLNPYYWVDDYPLLYGKNGSLDPITQMGSDNPLP